MHETSLSVVSVARLPALAVVLPRQAPSVTAPALGTLEDVYLPSPARPLHLPHSHLISKGLPLAPWAPGQPPGSGSPWHRREALTMPILTGILSQQGWAPAKGIWEPAVSFVSS